MVTGPLCFRYEVMRFCWLDSPQRTKVDEVYNLLQQIASKAPEEGAPLPKDGISAFEHKWEHLMPNQRHMSMDSVDDQLGSVSSGDSDLLAEDLSQPDSLEDLTAPRVEQAPQPQPPPRVSRKRVSAAAVSVPHAEMSEAAPAIAVASKKVEEPSTLPEIKISIVEETSQSTTAQAQQVQTPEEAQKAVAPETEFTEFTSHDASDKTTEGTPPTMSQVAPDALTSSAPSLGLPQDKEQNAVAEAAEDPFQMGDAQAGAGDALPKFQARLQDENLPMNSPVRPQPKPRKTSTPIAKEESSPSSSSSFSAGNSSSSTFLTARTSSPGNLTDAYVTASDSTLIINGQTKPNVSESSYFSVSGDGSLSFEILESAAVPPASGDFDKTADDSQNAQVLDPFPPSTTPSQSPFTEASLSVHKDDIFGEFTDASDVNGSSGPSPPNPPAPSAAVRGTVHRA